MNIGSMHDQIGDRRPDECILRSSICNYDFFKNRILRSYTELSSTHVSCQTPSQYVKILSFLKSIVMFRGNVMESMGERYKTVHYVQIHKDLCTDM